MANEIDLSWVAVELQADIISVVRDQIISHCEEVLYGYVNETVYARSSGMYERSGDVLNAVTVDNIKISGTKASFDVRIDPSKLSHVSPAKGAPFKSPWGKHAGFSNQAFTDGLIEILDQGGGSKWYEHPAANFYQLTFDELDNELVSVLASGIAAKGWDVSF